jgi:hypothetical protein
MLLPPWRAPPLDRAELLVTTTRVGRAAAGVSGDLRTGSATTWPRRPSSDRARTRQVFARRSAPASPHLTGPAPDRVLADMGARVKWAVRFLELRAVRQEHRDSKWSAGVPLLHHQRAIEDQEQGHGRYHRESRKPAGPRGEGHRGAPLSRGDGSDDDRAERADRDPDRAHQETVPAHLSEIRLPARPEGHGRPGGRDVPSKDPHEVARFDGQRQVCPVERHPPDHGHQWPRSGMYSVSV